MMIYKAAALMMFAALPTHLATPALAQTVGADNTETSVADGIRNPNKRGPATQFGERVRTRDDPGWRVRHANVQNLPHSYGVIERSHDLLHRREELPRVDPVDVDVVGAQSLEARVKRLN